MHDYTAGYDPTKPLNIEQPIRTFHSDTLEYLEEESDLDYLTFCRGNPVPASDYKLVFLYQKSEKKLKKTNVIFTSIHCLIVDVKVLDILKKLCPGDFQAFPVIIKNKPSKKIESFINHDYYLIYITRKVPAIDFERSEFDLIDATKGKILGNVIGVRKLRFKSNCMHGVDIARDSYIVTTKFVSQRLFHIFKENKITGIEFHPDWLSFYDVLTQKELKP